MIIEGISVVVTGGEPQLGRASAERFSKAGARVPIADLSGSAGAQAATRRGKVKSARSPMRRPRPVSWG